MVTAAIVPVPAREFLVEVVYVVKMTHRLVASTVEEALERAPFAEISEETQMLDIVSATVRNDSR